MYYLYDYVSLELNLIDSRHVNVMFPRVVRLVLEISSLYNIYNKLIK